MQNSIPTAIATASPKDFIDEENEARIRKKTITDTLTAYLRDTAYPSNGQKVDDNGTANRFSQYSLGKTDYDDFGDSRNNLLNEDIVNRSDQRRLFKPERDYERRQGSTLFNSIPGETKKQAFEATNQSRATVADVSTLRHYDGETLGGKETKRCNAW